MSNDLKELKINDPKSNVDKIVVDRDLCIGAGTCAVLAGTTFKVDSEGKVVILDAPSDNAENIIDAAKSCPVFAIKIYGKDGKLVYPKE